MALAVGADGTTYLGGSFTQFGRATGTFVPISAGTGKPAASFLRVNGPVFALASDGAGGWYIGGAFDHEGGVARPHLAHLGADGSLDPAWNPAPDGSVYAFAVRAGTIYVGGQFLQIDGRPRQRLAALDAVTGRALPWNPGVDGDVRALATYGDTLYVGGKFGNAGGEARSNVAAFSLSVSAARFATTWGRSTPPLERRWPGTRTPTPRCCAWG